MSDRPEDRTGPAADIPPDAPEADALEQALPWAPEEEQGTPADIPPDVPEADALDQARDADLGDDDEEPA